MANTCRASDRLGISLQDNWRIHVRKPVIDLMKEARQAGLVAFDDEDEAFAVFTGLLVGDSQRQLLLGGEDRMHGVQMKQHAEQALKRWLLIFDSKA